MPAIRFLGKVSPSGFNASLGSNPYGVAHNEQYGLKCNWQLHIVDSNVTVVMDLSQFTLETHLRPTVNLAQDVAGIATNLLTLQYGIAFQAIIDRLITPDGELVWVAAKDDELPKHLPFLRSHSNFEYVVRLAVSDHSLAMILRDVTEGIRQNYTGLVGASRAIDGICNYFTPAGRTREHGWPIMRAALNLGENYVKSISKQSQGPRHADWVDGGEPVVRLAMGRAWVCVNRFLEYRKRGEQPLVTPDFPLLGDSQK